MLITKGVCSAFQSASDLHAAVIRGYATISEMVAVGVDRIEVENAFRLSGIMFQRSGYAFCGIMPQSAPHDARPRRSRNFANNSIEKTRALNRWLGCKPLGRIGLTRKLLAIGVFV